MVNLKGIFAHLLRFLLAAGSSEVDELALEDVAVAVTVAAPDFGVACSCWRSSMAATRLRPALDAGIGVRKAMFWAA